MTDEASRAARPLHRLASSATDVVLIFAALGLSALLLQDVSATPVAVGVAAIIVLLPYQIFGSAALWLGQRGTRTAPDGQKLITLAGCAFIVLGFLINLSPVATVPIAAAIVPGFNVNGVWAHAATIAAVFSSYGLYLAATFVLGRLRRLVRQG
jgi:hypothetical protein